MDDFGDLINTFSKLDIKTSSSTENCPICHVGIALDKFSEHVYNCISSIDEKMAVEMGGSYDEQFELSSFYTPQNKCDLGSLCNRRDRNHFLNLKHPPIKCPICIKDIEMIDICDHVGSCMGPNEIKVAHTASADCEPLAKAHDASAKETISRDQAILMSGAIIEQHNSGNDVTDLLEKFSKLGFNKETLKKLL